MPSRLNARGSHGPRRTRLAHTATIALISILCAVVVCHDLFRTWQDRTHRIEDATREVTNLAWAEEQHAEAVFMLAETILTDLAERVRTDGTGPAQLIRLHDLMAERMLDSPLLMNLSVIDDKGILIADNRPKIRPVDITDRTYFQYHQTHVGSRPFVGSLTRSRVSDDLIIPVSIRISRTDGSFGGIVVAGITAGLFQDFDASLDLGRDGMAALYHESGDLLVRHPAAGSVAATSPLGSKLFRNALAQGPSGTFDSVSSVDGVRRIISFRRVAGYPLIVLAGLGKDEQLTAWRSGAWEHLLAAVVIALLLGFTALRLVGQIRALSRAERGTITATAQYSLLADNASDMIFTIDMQLLRRYVSPSSRDLLGYEPETLMGRSPVAIAHPEDAERVTECLNALTAGQDRKRITYRVRHQDGRWLWVEVAFKLMRDPESNAPLEICGAMRDISERMEAIAVLRHSEERFRLLLQSSAVTEAICLLDPDGSVETWNAAEERVKGYLPDEVIGRNFAMFFTAEGIASGEPVHLLATTLATGTFTTEVWLVRKDGSRFLARVVIDAIRNRDGTLRGFVKATRDITNDRVEEEQRAIIIEAAPNGMMIVNEAGLITLANTKIEHIFDFPAGSLVGQPLEILIPEGFRDAHAALRAAFTSGRTDRGMEPEKQFVGRKRDGSPVTIEIMLSPVKTPRGRIVVAALFDVTDRARAAEQLREAEARERLAAAATNVGLDRLSRHLSKARDRAEQANRAKSRFLAGMSHELRTPLNGVLGYAHLLHIEGGLNPTQNQRVDAMLEAGKHLLEMITCVLDLSEIEAEHVLLRPALLDVPAIAAACLDLVRPMAEAKGLILSMVQAPGASLGLVADPTRLRQVLLNLLGNAAKFTSHGAIELRMRVAADGSALRIEVADTGPGISAEQRQRLFQDFERLDTDDTRAVEGAGLGLALSARLVGLMGGSLGQEDNPGGGSVFWLELPLATEVESTSVISAERVEPADVTPPPPPAAYNVLVVDDVMMNRDIAGSFLRSAGHAVTCIEGGAEAVAAVAATDFDVVLMDVRMPGVDGIEASRRIRALQGPRGRVPIIALTAHAFTEQVLACHAAGMDSHLSKPFDPEALIAAVEHAVAAGRTDGAGYPASEPDPRPATCSAAADDVSVIGSEILILNRSAFERTAVLLSPAVVASHLQTIAELGDDLLRRLRRLDATTHQNDQLPDRQLVDAVHNLAGSAGMFGFDRLARLGRRFEHAQEAGSTETPDLADGLTAALEATLKVVHELDPVAMDL